MSNFYCHLLLSFPKSLTRNADIEASNILEKTAVVIAFAFFSILSQKEFPLPQRQIS
jgi:hypothetical protein